VQAEAHQTARGLEYKDTALRRVYNDMLTFATLTNSKMAVVLRDEHVKKVIPPLPASGRSPSESSHMPPAFQFQFEHVAVNHESAFVRTAASVLALGGLLNLRNTELQRSSITVGIQSAVSDPDSPLDLLCDAGKGRSRSEMFPFFASTYPEGVNGDARVWMSGLSEHAAGQACLLNEFVTPPGKPGILNAIGWKVGTPLVPSKWASLYVEILGLSPLCCTPLQLKLYRWNTHAPHGFGAGVVRVFLNDGFSSSDFHETGRWSNTGGADTADDLEKIRASSMPLRYSEGSPARSMELSLRRRICKVFHRFLGGQEWQAVVPFQEDGVVSYDFLRPPSSSSASSFASSSASSSASSTASSSASSSASSTASSSASSSSSSSSASGSSSSQATAAAAASDDTEAAASAGPVVAVARGTVIATLPSVTDDPDALSEPDERQPLHRTRSK
jgi:hypothetical protein